MRKKSRASIPLTRAREQRAERDVRVAEVVDMMLGGKWFTGSSHAEKQEAWGLDLHTVREIATDASRVVRTLVNLDPDEARAKLFAALDEHRRLALEKERTVVTKDGDPVTFADADLKAANQSVGIQAQLLGLVSTNLKVTVDAARIAAMTPAERLAECMRVRAELDAEIAELKKQTGGAA